MLDLEGKEIYRKIIIDSATGNEVELMHRLPTTEEELEYQQKQFAKRDRKNISPEDIAKNLSALRIEYGAKIVTGFREGDLGKCGQKISSDPTSPLFFAGWKELLREKAPRILAAVASAVFEGNLVKIPDEPEEDGDPFGKT